MPQARVRSSARIGGRGTIGLCRGRRQRRRTASFGGRASTEVIARWTQRSSWRLVRRFSLDTRNQPAIGRPRITATSAAPRATNELVASGSTRTRRRPGHWQRWPCGPESGTRDRRTFFSMTSGRSSSSSRIRSANFSSYATTEAYDGVPDASHGGLPVPANRRWGTPALRDSGARVRGVLRDGVAVTLPRCNRDPSGGRTHSRHRRVVHRAGL